MVTVHSTPSPYNNFLITIIIYFQNSEFRMKTFLKPVTEKPGVQSFVLLQLTLASSWTGTTPASASCWTGSSQDCVQVRDRIFHCSDGREQIPSLAGGDWQEIDEEVRGRDNTDDKRSRRKKKWWENLSREREKTAGVNQTRVGVIYLIKQGVFVRFYFTIYSRCRCRYLV